MNRILSDFLGLSAENKNFMNDVLLVIKLLSHVRKWTLVIVHLNLTKTQLAVPTSDW